MVNSEQEQRHNFLAVAGCKIHLFVPVQKRWLSAKQFYMKKYSLIFTLLLAMFFLLPASVFGAYTYTRSPAGFTITSPVSFDTSFDDFQDIGCDPDRNYWSLSVYDDNEPEPNRYTGNYVASTTQSNNFVLTLPVGNYVEVMFECSFSGEWEDTNQGNTIEWIPFETIFEVVAGGGGGGLAFTMPTNFATGTIAYVGALFTDLSLPIYILIGFSVFFLVGNWLFEKFKEKK